MSFKGWEDKVAELAAEETRAAEKKQLESLVGGNPNGFEAWRLGDGDDRAGTVSTGFVKVEPPLTRTREEVERALRDADRRQRECDAKYATNAAGCNTLSPHRTLGGERTLVDRLERDIETDGAILQCKPSPECGIAHRVVVPVSMARRVHDQRHWSNTERASRLADECGALARDNRDLLVENARLRRRIEDMERKGKKR